MRTPAFLRRRNILGIHVPHTPRSQYEVREQSWIGEFPTSWHLAFARYAHQRGFSASWGLDIAADCGVLIVLLLGSRCVYRRYVPTTRTWPDVECQGLGNGYVGCGCCNGGQPCLSI